MFLIYFSILFGPVGRVVVVQHWYLLPFLLSLPFFYLLQFLFGCAVKFSYRALQAGFHWWKQFVLLLLIYASFSCCAKSHHEARQSSPRGSMLPSVQVTISSKSCTSYGLLSVVISGSP